MTLLLAMVHILNDKPEALGRIVHCHAGQPEIRWREGEPFMLWLNASCKAFSPRESCSYHSTCLTFSNAGHDTPLHRLFCRQRSRSCVRVRCCGSSCSCRPCLASSPSTSTRGLLRICFWLASCSPRFSHSPSAIKYSYISLVVNFVVIHTWQSVRRC